MNVVVRSLATLCTAVFFGAALYISLVQHPAALEAGNAIYLSYFPAMYRRASVLQAGTAVVGLSAGLVAWRAGGRRLWLAAAILLGSAVPLTLLVIRPVNDVLMSPDASRDADVGALFVQWGRLHLVRTMASGAALLCCLAALLQDQDCRISGERMPPLRQLWIRRRDAHSRE